MSIDQYPKLASAYRYLLIRGGRLVKGIDPDKVVFCCFQGRSYGDNPRVISERLHERCPQAKIVWLLTRAAAKRLKDELPDYIKPVYYKTKEAFLEQATARVWVDNFTKQRYMTLARGRQFYVQTWHGDRAIKKICYDLGMKEHRRIEEQCARVMTGSKFGEGLYRTAFRYKGEYIKAGAPRNDILVKSDPDQIRRVREKLGIAPEVKLLLYAPTYRDNADVLPKSAQMDLDRTLRCLEAKTGEKWLCLFRAHYLSAGIDLEAVQDRIVDVTAYEDMAELLLAADMVLTDYSSCAMDFIIRDLPALFYIPDWEEYVATRGVYFDVHDTPFMLAHNQGELEALIEGLTPEKARENCAAIRDYFGYYETGHAADAACDYIIERLGSRKRFDD
ncbi:MAG: CDP-glycerol glycerophosphotransferase family protein [Clostridia bacterium]|nr:CDP-glycerol glycerophosphotransferase family protein [Clostridia bacterium]